MRTKTQKEVRTSGLTFSNNGQRREKKMSNLKATKYQSLTKLSFFDKQVIAGALGQLRIFHMYFQSFLNCPRRFAAQEIL